MPDDREREIFLQLLAEHEAQLLGFLCAIVPNIQDAEDLFQQTVLTMWQKFADFEKGTSFVAWGCQVARFKALNHLKGRRATVLDDEVLDLLMATQQAEDAGFRHARRRALSECLEKLSEADRKLIESAYMGEQSIKSLAKDLARPPAGVYNSLARIRAVLFRCIQSTLAREGHTG